jgi:hypothetical protein
MILRRFDNPSANEGGPELKIGLGTEKQAGKDSSRALVVGAM